MPLGPQYRSSLVYEDVDLKKMRRIGRKIDEVIKVSDVNENRVTVLFSSNLVLTDNEVSLLKKGYVATGWDEVIYKKKDNYSTVITLIKN